MEHLQTRNKGAKVKQKKKSVKVWFWFDLYHNDIMSYG